MESNKNIIKATALMLMCACVLNGCAAGKSTRVEKAERIVRAGETVKETGASKSTKPAAPQKLLYSFNEVKKTVKFSWEPVENAAFYEVKFMNEPVVQVDKPEYIVSNIEENTDVTVWVRSVSANKEYSDWLKGEGTVMFQVKPPEKAAITIDGDYLFFVWKPMENAAGYEIEYSVDGSDEVKTISTSAIQNYIILNLVEGQKINYKIRTYKIYKNEKRTSDWKTYSIENPKYLQMEDYSSITACTLDANRISAFVKAKGGKITTKKYSGGILVEMSLRDDAQHTFFAAAKRFLLDIGEAFLEGYVDGAKENALDTVAESEDVKDFINKLDEEATKEAKKGVFKRIFNRTKVDTDIHCVVQYKYSDMAPELAKVAILKANNRKFAKDFAETYGKYRQNNGAYLLTVSGTEQQFYVYLGEKDNYWILTIYPTHFLEMVRKSSTAKT